MNYEDLIFNSASSAVPALFVFFVIITILDFIRTMLFSK